MGGLVKKFFLFTFLAFSLLCSVVEVVTRVYDGEKFVRGLGPEDFTVLENGKTQNLAAFYAVEEGVVVRSWEKDLTVPQRRRLFILHFRFLNYPAGLEQGIKLFLERSIRPSDVLHVVTSKKALFFQFPVLLPDMINKVMEKIKKELRKDINLTSSRYRELLSESKLLLRSLRHQSGFLERGDPFASVYGVESLLDKYEHNLRELQRYAGVNEEKLLNLASRLKKETNRRKIVVFITSNFPVPSLDSQTYMALSQRFRSRPDIAGRIERIFTFSKMLSPQESDRLEKAFADSGAEVFLLYIIRSEPGGEDYIEEFSGGGFKVFSAIAKATGGEVLTGTSLVPGFRKLIHSLDNYYLLYYRSSVAGKGLRKIHVRVKGKEFTVLCRKFYFKSP